MGEAVTVKFNWLGVNPDPKQWEALEEDRFRCYGRGLEHMDMNVIKARTAQALASIYEIYENDQRIGSLALGLTPDYEHQHMALTMLWVSVLPNRYTDEVHAGVRDVTKQLAEHVNCEEVEIRGRTGWSHFADAVKAREVFRVWRVKTENL